VKQIKLNKNEQNTHTLQGVKTKHAYIVRGVTKKNLQGKTKHAYIAGCKDSFTLF
jgi:hypothetical protein